jgi:integrase/recombinase XerD
VAGEQATSPLRQALADYLALRRSLGYTLARPAKLLGQFISFLEVAGAETVTVEHALSWARLPDGNSNWWAHRLSVVRGFANYLHSIDERHEVPAGDLLRWRGRRANPYLYSDDEIVALIDAATVLRFAFRAATYQTLIGLLAVTGMRVGEAIRLDLGDFDQRAGVITVRWTKFDKTRQLPLDPTTVDALRVYLARPDRPRTTALFCSPGGSRLVYSNVHATFRILRAQAGLQPKTATCRPRIHDMRHSFAVRSLLDAYRDGTDIGHRLALLSTYLGHVNPAGTYWYLSAAPELLALAAQRLDQHRGQP